MSKLWCHLSNLFRHCVSPLQCPLTPIRATIYCDAGVSMSYSIIHTTEGSCNCLMKTFAWGKQDCYSNIHASWDVLRELATKRSISQFWEPWLLHQFHCSFVALSNNVQNILILISQLSMKQNQIRCRFLLIPCFIFMSKHSAYMTHNATDITRGNLPDCTRLPLKQHIVLYRKKNLKTCQQISDIQNWPSSTREVQKNWTSELSGSPASRGFIERAHWRLLLTCHKAARPQAHSNQQRNVRLKEKVFWGQYNHVTHTEVEIPCGQILFPGVLF